MSIRKVISFGLYYATVGLLFLTSGETAARLDDWLHWGFSPLAPVPDCQSELIVFEGSGGPRRGRPHGKFKQIELNEYGFRGPPITEEPPEGTQRVMVLGASGTFGMYESPGKEYPAQLSALLTSSGDLPRFEVVNVALLGLSCPTMKYYWTQWASHFRPTWVMIYPPTHLYLGPWDVPGANAPEVVPAQPDHTTSPKFESRFKARLREYKPAFLRRWQSLQVVEALLAGKPNGGVFDGPPVDRLQAVTDDLSQLVDAISATGAKPVLLTHAISAALPSRPEDADHLEGMRGYTLRATPEVLLAFEHEANERIRGVGRRRAIPVIDLDARLGGRRDLFADLVHFNDSGAEKVAQILADWLRNAGQPRQ